MKNKAKLYAKALADVVFRKGFDEKKVINNFIKLLKSAGLERKSKEILDLAEDLLLVKQGKRKITFETARKTKPGGVSSGSSSQRKLLESFIKRGDIVKEKINPELIAGIKIIINGSQQFDASMQSKLQNLFA